MKRFLSVWVLSLGVLSLNPVSLRAETSEEAQLETERKGIDQNTSVDSQKVTALSEQYKVSPETVQNLRNKGQGWGEVSIGLATAEELAKKDPITYPTTADALVKIQDLRAEKMGWGKIANSLGFKLGPVISATKHTRNELRAGEKQKADSAGKPGNAEKSGKPDHAGKPDHTGKPEKAPKPDKPMKPDHSSKPGKPDRPTH
jgi:hypothetical protein